MGNRQMQRRMEREQLDSGLIIPQEVKLGVNWIEQTGMPPLAESAAFMAGNQLQIVGGMTQRLAVAAQLMGHIFIHEYSPLTDEQVAGMGGEASVKRAIAAVALDLADHLMAVEREQRTGKVANGSVA